MANPRNNKGFTLVELIIVIAIIAVLAAVLAPQYLRYVERARQSNDLQVATSIMRATTAAIADPRVGVASNENVTVTWDTGQDPATISSSNSGVEAEIAATMGWTDVDDVDNAQSEAGTAQDFSFIINAATGNIVVANGSGRWVSEIGINEMVASTTSP